MGILRLKQMIVKSMVGAFAAAMLLAACSQTPPQYFAPQLASASGGEVEPQAINSPAYAIRPPLPGRPGYLATIRYIDNGVKYIDPYAEFFISYDGQMCFRGLVNRQVVYFANHQTYWCMYPTAVSNVEALENDISYVDTVRLWCMLEAPQCARRIGFPNFPDDSGWIDNSIRAQTRPFREQRNAIEYLIYLMGGNAAGAQPLRLPHPTPLAISREVRGWKAG
jgi:hypothetical protein